MDSRIERRRRRHARATRRAADEEDTEFTPVAETGPRVGERCVEGEACWPDLLHDTPLRSVGVEHLRASLRFAFESGDAGGALKAASEHAPVAASTFQSEGFTSGLFLHELVDELFTLEVAGERFRPGPQRLIRLLSLPPDDMRDVSLRQGILRELRQRPELVTCLERAYASLYALRGLLDEQPIGASETARRKVEVLTLVKAFFVELDTGLAQAESALSRLYTFAHETRASVAFGELEEVLAFDAHMATLELRIVLGSDGKLRDFELLGTRENRENALVHAPVSRAWSRIISWLRGYRYNESAVLLAVLDRVFERLEDALLPCFRLVGDLEFYLGNLSFARRADDAGLSVCLAELTEPPEAEGSAGPRTLVSLWNPLLWLQDVEPKACDLELTGHDAVLLVTGPNSGGKTRLLQAAALAQLMGQSGLFVAAAQAKLTRAPSLFVSLVEEAPADQKEGRLGTELMRVRRLFEGLRPGSFVALDEICSGTNPSEGIAIFEMVLSLMPRLRPQVLLTTHFLDAARRLEEEAAIPRLCFMCVELGQDATPTFQFVPGVAETSLAREVAARLGVTREELEALVDRQGRSPDASGSGD